MELRFIDTASDFCQLLQLWITRAAYLVEDRPTPWVVSILLSNQGERTDSIPVMNLAN